MDRNDGESAPRSPGNGAEGRRSARRHSTYAERGQPNGSSRMGRVTLQTIADHVGVSRMTGLERVLAS